MAHAASDYVLVRTSEEYQRLRRQALIWEPATRRVLEHVGLRPGMRCLDVGCGPGEVMRLMGEMVGPEGEVVGIDSDVRLGNEALAALETLGISRFRFIETDVTSPNGHDLGRFDVTFARLMLIHLVEPQKLLRKMAEWTRSGGYVVVQDHDMGRVDVFPALSGWPDFMNVLLGVFERTGRDPRLGAKLNTLMAEAGLGEPSGTDVAGKLTSLRDASPMLVSVFRSLLPQALQLGLITQARADEFLAEVDAAVRSDVAYTVSWPLLTAAWVQTAG